ncbi:MAG: PKD domain-containing protein, partial [Ginsengibacter sp.]
MFPVHATFPEFVPDQVLTSDDLNNLFGFLDEQGRMTRTNLIGIGIVCGLQIKTAADKSWITITKGVGVTSEGYLVRLDENMTFTAFKSFDPLKDDYYEKFVNENVNPKTSKFTLWELRPDISDGGNNLADIFSGLDNYIVMLFVELLKEQNKNCDPNSCDDKGINVTLTIRPLLVAKNSPPVPLINTLIGSTGNPLSFSPFYTLPDIRMPRYDVPNTFPIQTEQVLQGYIDVLTESFLTKVETTLTTAFTTFGTFLGNPGGSSPFSGLKSGFNFVNNITTKDQLLHLQYYYDIISDLLLAYNEFRKTGNGILSTCAPNTSLFPRHLLLGEAVPVAGMVSSYRHYFIYSPLFEKKNLILELKFLFSKMELMKNNIFIPPFVSAANAPHDGIRITPSLLNDAPLSQKSIPYYYKPLQLFPSWNFDKTLRGKGNQNLCYHATIPGYNADDDFVRSPLKYDLEPYNFLRIEGHIGLKYQEVIQQINMQKTFFRLPIEVIALSTGEADLSKIADAIISCNIRDLQTSYEIIRREWEAVIGKMIEYLHDNQDAARPFFNEASVGTDVFGDYLVLLNLAKTFMVPDLKVFISKYDDFLIPVYEEVEKQSQQMRTILVDLLNNDDDLNRERRNLAEDLIDHFDEVVLSCKKGGFRSIFQQFNSRLNEIYSNMFFNRFIEKHPGIQHKAGVPMGGTFIVVYHKKHEVPELKGPFTITGFARTPGGEPIHAGVVQVKNTNITTFLNTSGSFTIVVNSLPVILTVFKFFGQFETGELLVSSPAQSPVTIRVPSPAVIIGEEENNVYNSLSNDDVIADFYLPYICSSNCTPIQFVIQEMINQSPVAEAGPDQEIVLPQNSTLLDGSNSSDPENKPLKFSWALVSAQQNVVFSDAASPKPAVSNLIEPGQYIFELTITDEEGAKSHTDQVIINVLPEPNLPPTANAGENQVVRQPASTTVLNGQGTDPENKPLTFAWSFVSGPA